MLLTIMKISYFSYDVDIKITYLHNCILYFYMNLELCQFVAEVSNVLF